MGGRGTGGGRGGGRGQGNGQGRRRHRHDGSGRGACLGPNTGADGKNDTTAGAIATAPVAAAPANKPAGASRARMVAIIAAPESCLACGTCVDACRRGAITLAETAVVDPKLCTGCGICVDDCAYGALALTEV